MRASLERICNAFIENRNIIKNTFKWDSNYTYAVCANLFCSRQKTAQKEELLSCKRLVQEKTGAFSNFRGSLKLPAVTMLAIGSSPEAAMDQALDHYGTLKKEFHGSQYLALAALLLEDLGVRADAEARVSRAKTLYRHMKKEHRLLTSAEDSVFAVLLAFSELPDDALMEDMEACYQILRRELRGGNAAQSASHVLAMTAGSPEEKTRRVIQIYQGLKEHGRNYGKNYELSTLAAVSVLDADPNQIVQDILDVDAFLAGQKGYGVFGLGRKTRLMHAAMLTADDYCQSNASIRAVRNHSEQTAAQGAVMTSTLAILAAQQAAMCAVMISSTAAATSAASASS